MLKKILTIIMTLLLTFSLVGCSKEKETVKSGKTDNGITIKSTDDFSESDGLIKYFTINDTKIAVPETVGEYANYLEQIGTVTLNATGNSPSEETIKAGANSSMVAYLNVETDDGDVRMYLRYKNPTKKEISVAEATVTYIEVKYDKYAEVDYDKTLKGVEVVTDNGSLPLDGKMAYAKVKKMVGEPQQETDGRFTYEVNGYKTILDCCNENRTGIFRGFIIEYPES